jgi:hypothetical protein
MSYTTTDPWAVAERMAPLDRRHNPNRPLWTLAELRQLRTHAATMTAAQIGALIGRTADAVKHKARQRGLSLRKCGERCSWAKYSDAQCEQARQLHEAGTPIRRIGEIVQMPFHALHSVLYFKRVG